MSTTPIDRIPIETLAATVRDREEQRNRIASLLVGEIGVIPSYATCPLCAAWTRLGACRACTEPTVVLFVYGTLRLGHCNYWRFFARQARHRGRVRTERGWAISAGGSARLVPLDPAQVAARESVGQAVDVVGDLFEVPSAHVLGAVDNLEGHPHAWRRGPIRVDGGREVETYHWAQPSEIRRLSPTGDYSENAP